MTSITKFYLLKTLPSAHLLTKIITSARSPSLPPLNASISLLFLHSFFLSPLSLSSASLLPLLSSLSLSAVFLFSLSLSLSPLNVFSPLPLPVPFPPPLISLCSHCLYCSPLPSVFPLCSISLFSFHSLLSLPSLFSSFPPNSSGSKDTATTVSIFLNEAAVQQSIPG